MRIRLDLISIYSYLVLFALVSGFDGKILDVPKINNIGSNFFQEESRKYPVCYSCQIVAASFNKGIQRTSRGKHEGGDAEWERSRLANYAVSEIRLVDIEEELCSELTVEKNQCHEFASEHEDLLEKWWLHYQKDYPDLATWLCIHKLEVCCLSGQFGSKCIDCPGGKTNPCNGNGYCEGEGTREGNGTCKCKVGYEGNACEDCQKGWYKNSTGSERPICEHCDGSCLSSCSKGGPQNCDDCKTGWLYQKNQGCIDQDECLLLKNSCLSTEFCVNTMGSYKCIACDAACYNCSGQGPDNCITCASDYLSKTGICIKKEPINYFRYATYGGLMLATGITSQKNIWLAATIGICVAIYIGLSEYTLKINAYSI